MCEPCPSYLVCDGTNSRCPDGYASHTDSSGTLNCCNNATQYWSGSACFDCPVGATCDESGVISCSEGEYLQWGGCYLCPSNATCDGININCGTGKYLFVKDYEYNECRGCPSGAVCDGTYANCGEG